MESEKQTIEQIDLMPIIRRAVKYLKKLWVLILVLSLLGGAANYLRVRSGFTPRYESKSLISVSSGYSGSIFTSSYYYDSTAAEQVVESFPNLLSTDIMRDLIRNRIGKSYINGTISASSIAGTNLFELKVTSSNAQDAYDILCAVIDCYPQVAVYAVDNPELIIRQEPTLPTAPYNSFNGTNSVIKGSLAGLFAGFMLLLIPALLSRTVADADELKKLVNLPLLVSLPHVNLKKRKKNVHTLISSDDDEGFGESIRGLRTKVRKQLADREGKIVLLTSTLPGEGKSTISANLALALSAEGHRVVLVDADLRNQSVYRMFGNTKCRKNLMDCMQDEKLNILDCLETVPDTKLYFLSGDSTNRRYYSIDGKNLRRCLDKLSLYFDCIILDSPPTGIVSDTALLARHAHSVLYVVKQDHASQAQVLDSIAALHARDIPLAGCILNDVPRRRARYGHGYGYGYGYSYSKHYGYGEKNSK